MSRKKYVKHYYFPQNLQRQLDCILSYPLTLIEAPSGFGKTTAIREYTRERPKAQTFWYTCLGESTEKSWKKIAALFKAVDTGIAEGLAKLQSPELDTLPDIARLLRQCRSRQEIFLVVDNYQLFMTTIHRDIINVLSVHGNEKLHIIVVTQPLAAPRKTTIHTSRILFIDTDSFRFDTESIGCYFRMEGLPLAEKDLEDIQRSTGGWIAAVCLQLIHYRNTGNFEKTGTVDSLIETGVWNRLDREEQDFLLGLSLLGKCNSSQAVIMAGEKELPEKIETLLQSNVFISFYQDNYFMSGLLRNYLCTILTRDRGEDFRGVMLRRAAEASIQVGDDYEAKRFYYQIGDYDAILCLRYQYEYMDDEKDHYNFIAAIIRRCPDEILRKYPHVLIDMALHMICSNKYAEFERTMSFLKETLAQGPFIKEEEQKRLAGEIALVMSFSAFNNIREMGEWNRRALELLDGEPSRFLLPHTPWTFGNISIVCFFWSVPGELEQELRTLEEYLPIYSKIVNGHGTGADSMMRAEALFLNGRDADAEVLCYKVLYLAEGQLQTSICLCAEFLLTRIALFRGEGEAYFQGIERIRQRGEEGGLFYIRMAELCIATLSLITGSPDEIAPWISDEESIWKIMRFQAVPGGFIIYGKFLLMKKKYKELERALEILLNGIGVPYMLPRLYGMLYLAMVKQNEGKLEEARAEVNRALEIAIKDRIFLPFAEQGAPLRALLEDTRRDRPEQQELSVLISICKRQEAGVKNIEKFFHTGKTPLSRREREIAVLAQEGHPIREIAEECFISENAVTALLENVYRKLNIHSRAELENKVF
jgi:LuxR family maltose regulon positive regulatory protein